MIIFLYSYILSIDSQHIWFNVSITQAFLSGSESLEGCNNSHFNPKRLPETFFFSLGTGQSRKDQEKKVEIGLNSYWGSPNITALVVCTFASGFCSLFFWYSLSLSYHTHFYSSIIPIYTNIKEKGGKFLFTPIWRGCECFCATKVFSRPY